MTIQCIIVDDEDLARESLKMELTAFPLVEVAAECRNGLEAIKAVQELKPDLIFLDIQMPKLDGFDVLELLGDEAPVVVFVTAYDEYALKAFEAQAFDYLLKPVRRERLNQVLEKAMRVKPAASDKARQQAILAYHQEHRGSVPRILVRMGTEVHVIPVGEIMRIEAQDDYVRIHTASRSYLKTDQISSLEKMLDSRTFCRIHRSHLINISFIRKIEPYSKESYKAILSNGNSLPISRAGYARLKTLL